jgi:hypothetical protein
VLAAIEVVAADAKLAQAGDVHTIIVAAIEVNTLSGLTSFTLSPEPICASLSNSFVSIAITYSSFLYNIYKYFFVKKNLPN